MTSDEIQDLAERGMKITSNDTEHHMFDVAQYVGVDFGDLITTKTTEFIRKYRLTPDILYLGWGTYLAILAYVATKSNNSEPEINEPKIMGLNALVMDTEHGLNLGFSDNGKSATMYHRSSL